MGAIEGLGLVNLTIPAWQMAFYIGVVSAFMMIHEIRGCLLTTYIFGLYWGFYLFGRDFLNAAQGNPVVITAYISVGIILAAFSLLLLFYEK